MSINPHDYLSQNPQLQRNQRRTLIVIILTVITMLAELIAGWLTGSMALLADGWHMASHAAALFITYITYRMATHPKMVRNFNFGGGKLIPLGGYTSAILLFLVSLLMAVESVDRLMNPVSIRFTEAIIVAAIGLFVNVISALILRDHSHHHHGDSSHSHYHDHNIKGAYLHVIADAITSVAAIAALVAGLYWNAVWLDPVIGIVGAAVILKWAWDLIKETGWELLDGHAKGTNYDEVRRRLEDENVTILDLHIWKIAPGTLAAELIIDASHPKGLDYYREILVEEFSIDHPIIEERPKDQKT